MAVGEDVDLTNWGGYEPSKAGFRHHDRAMVGWLDGHVKPHFRSFIQRLGDEEDGVPLAANDRLIHWNLQ
jgi:prepilin-type processing-associated H-X9-DG protein